MEKSTQKLIDELTNKLIISLNDNEALCPTCKGLRFILEQRGKQAYIESCPDCYNGKVYVCKHCGKHNKSNYCNCDGARKERNAEFNKKQQEKEQKLFGKAKKIKFNDYNGYFLYLIMKVEFMMVMRYMIGYVIKLNMINYLMRNYLHIYGVLHPNLYLIWI